MDSIVNKIKALLAKAASTTNVHEAEIFLAKAHELMEKHQLSSADLEKDDPIDMTVGTTANGGASPDWDFQLMFSVSRYFGCKAIQWKSYQKLDGTYIRAGQYQMKIVGRESARITAIEMHKYLVATVRRLGRENATPYQGAATLARRIGRALAIRLDSLVPDEPETVTEAGKNALVTLNGVVAKYNELFPDSRTIKSPGVWTSDKAHTLADGIGLSQQVSTAGTKRLR